MTDVGKGCVIVVMGSWLIWSAIVGAYLWARG
jgi:hypothetical protein